MKTVAEDYSPPPSPSPADFTKESDRDEVAEEDDND